MATVRDKPVGAVKEDFIGPGLSAGADDQDGNRSEAANGPEQAHQVGAVGRAADDYHAGRVFQHVLDAAPPFRGFNNIESGTPQRVNRRRPAPGSCR